MQLPPDISYAFNKASGGTPTGYHHLLFLRQLGLLPVFLKTHSARKETTVYGAPTGCNVLGASQLLFCRSPWKWRGSLELTRIDRNNNS